MFIIPLQPLPQLRQSCANTKFRAFIAFVFSTCRVFLISRNHQMNIFVVFTFCRRNNKHTLQCLWRALDLFLSWIVCYVLWQGVFFWVLASLFGIKILPCCIVAQSAKNKQCSGFCPTVQKVQTHRVKNSKGKLSPDPEAKLYQIACARVSDWNLVRPLVSMWRKLKRSRATHLFSVKNDCFFFIIIIWIGFKENIHIYV